MSDFIDWIGVHVFKLLFLAFLSYIDFSFENVYTSIFMYILFYRTT
jgi:hypothetical protein